MPIQVKVQAVIKANAADPHVRPGLVASTVLDNAVADDRKASRCSEGSARLVSRIVGIARKQEDLFDRETGVLAIRLV